MRVTLNLRFPGQYFDAETGLHYNYFRDYDPVVGRYLESDPIGLRGGVNTYGYVLNQPLYWRDPLGLAVQICSMFDPFGMSNDTYNHTFLCSNVLCSGKYPGSDKTKYSSRSQGVIGDDSKKKPLAYCSDVPLLKCGKESFVRCVEKRLVNRGPTLDIYDTLRSNCGEWAIGVIRECRNECVKQ